MGLAAMNPVQIRPLKLEDYDEVHALWASTEGVGLGESDTREAVAAFLERNPGLSLAAVLEDRIVGAVLCGHDGRRGYLHHLAVLPDWRRRGVGRTIVRQCLERLHAAGIPKCNLFLYADNAAGEAFWTRLGWKVRADLHLVQRPTGSADGPGNDSCKSC